MITKATNDNLVDFISAVCVIRAKFLLWKWEQWKFTSLTFNTL